MSWVHRDEDVRIAKLPVGEHIETLWQELMAFGHSRPLDDDASIMGLEFLGSGPGL